MPPVLDVQILQALYTECAKIGAHDASYWTKDPDFFSFFAKLSDISIIDPLGFTKSISSPHSAMQENFRMPPQKCQTGLWIPIKMHYKG